MNIDERLRAASKALKDSSVAQVDAASQLREIVRHTDQPVAHGHTAVLRDEPQESPRPLTPSLPPSGKASTAPAGSSAAVTPTSRWTDGEARSTFHSQSPSGNAVARLLRSTWRYKPLIATAVLLGALLGYGWAARQPTLYQGVTRVVLGAGSDPTSLRAWCARGPPSQPGTAHELLAGPGACGQAERQQDLHRDPAPAPAGRGRPRRRCAHDPGSRLEREGGGTAGRRGGSRLRRCPCPTITPDHAPTPDHAAPAAGNVGWAGRRACRQAGQPCSPGPACGVRSPATGGPKAAHGGPSRAPTRPSVVWQHAAVPQQPISPGPGRAMAVGMLLGLLAAAVLVWWLTRRQGPTSRSSA